MAWNEPGGGKDPWGGKRGNDGPPDLDEALNQLKKKFSSFGGGSNGSGGPDGKSLLPVVAVVLLVLWGLMGFYQVDEKEQAVVLRLGKYHDTLGSGLQWNPKLIDKVYTCA